MIMINPYAIIVVGLIGLITSCMREPDKHDDFMSHSDCVVYVDEVEVENYDFGRVEFIDTNRASGCAKSQLQNVYILYHDTICIAVYNQHPKDNIKTIEGFVEKYQTDTTRVSAFVQFDSSLRITVDRLCKDPNDKYHYGTCIWWRDIEYPTVTKPCLQTKDEVLRTWYQWSE